jgi:hypothetical protein
VSNALKKHLTPPFFNAGFIFCRGFHPSTAIYRGAVPMLEYQFFLYAICGGGKQGGFCRYAEKSRV